MIPALRAAALLGVVILAACSTTPERPLLSPIQPGSRYGYEERQTGDETYEVSYLGPSRRTWRTASERADDYQAARQQAIDLMLGRAAQIALQRGYAGFRVGQIRTDTDTVVQQYYDDPFLDPYYGPYNWRYRRFGLWGPGPVFPTTDVYLQPRVSADITLLRNPGPGDYAAEEVLRQMRQTYPTAEGPAGGFQSQ
jgi:hypothetical protein